MGRPWPARPSGLAHLEASMGNVAARAGMLEELEAGPGAARRLAWGIAVLHAARRRGRGLPVLGDGGRGRGHRAGLPCRVHPRLDPIRPIALRRTCWRGGAGRGPPLGECPHAPDSGTKLGPYEILAPLGARHGRGVRAPRTRGWTGRRIRRWPAAWRVAGPPGALRVRARTVAGLNHPTSSCSTRWRRRAASAFLTMDVGRGPESRPGWWQPRRHVAGPGARAPPSTAPPTAGGARTSAGVVHSHPKPAKRDGDRGRRPVKVLAFGPAEGALAESSPAGRRR